MCRIYVSALALTLLIPVLIGQGRGAQPPEAQEAAARYVAADIRVMAPGVVYNAGLLNLAAAYTKETGKKVAVTSVGMGGIVNAVKTANPQADVIMLPFELMSTLSLDAASCRAPSRRLAARKWALRCARVRLIPTSRRSKTSRRAASAKAVMRSMPAAAWWRVIEDRVIRRAEFSGVNSPVSTQGEGGQALVRGEGDMALQAICEILPYKQIELVGKLPRDLGAWIDMSTAVSARAMHRDDALRFIKYLLRPESNTEWKAKGLERFN